MGLIKERELSCVCIIIVCVGSTTKTTYQSVAAENGRDEESATLMSRDENVSTTSKSSSSNNGVSLKTVAYGLGVVELACSGSFVAGRSATRYKLAQASTGMAAVQSTTTPTSLPRL